MLSKLTFVVALLAGFMSTLARECPSSCPLIVTAHGSSGCCSIGDRAPGCGVCDAPSCSENNLEPCSGENCRINDPDCYIADAGGV